MASKLCTSLLLLFLVLLSAATSSASAADCSTIVLSMADCLSFVQSGSTVEKPEGSCCSGLKMVLKTGPECLCEAYKSSASMGITLNATKALSLPQACKIVAPSAAKCGLSLPPAAAPDASSPTATAKTPESSAGANSEAQAPAPGSFRPASSSSQSICSTSLTIALLLALFFSGF